LEQGIVPKNKFGNVELFHSNMLPIGATHLAHKGIGRIAKQLGVDYGEAVVGISSASPFLGCQVADASDNPQVGFEFRSGRSYPTIHGIVVPSGMAETILAAYIESTIHRATLAQTAARKRARKNWQRIVGRVILRLRVRKEYGAEIEEERVRMEEEKKEKKRLKRKSKDVVVVDEPEPEQAGGFLPETAGEELDEEQGYPSQRRVRRKIVSSSSESEKPAKRIPKTLGDSSSESESEPKPVPVSKMVPRRLADSSDEEDEDERPRKVVRKNLDADEDGEMEGDEEEDRDTDDEWAGFGGGFIAE
jgi:hypothetical protein